jgi:hypothetical protein
MKPVSGNVGGMIQAQEAQPPPPPKSFMDRHGETLFVIGAVIVIMLMGVFKIWWRRFWRRGPEYDL